MANPNTATAADFDKSAHDHALAFWLWLIVAGITGYFFGWFSVFPGILAAVSGFRSMASTAAGEKLRKGTYPLPNPNNGAPDGDARNLR